MEKMTGCENMTAGAQRKTKKKVQQHDRSAPQWSFWHCYFTFTVKYLFGCNNNSRALQFLTLRYFYLISSVANLGISSVDPDVLRELGNLEELNLSKNVLKALDLNGISLPSLKVLNLSENQLSTVHIDTSTALASLECLDVSGNAEFEVSTKAEK